ncbi:MAG: MFS transporter [Acidimicrobiia bacterium]|nr:MAG: MFS transporter [Acidimicrobiia bacterium]
MLKEPSRTEAPNQADPSSRRWWILAVMSIGVLIVFIDNTVVNTALPAISVDLGASISQLQWVVNSYTLVLAGLLLLGGSLGDLYGRRKWMTIGLVLFGAAATGAAFATNIETLIAMRAAQGLGAALVLPGTLSIITNVFPRGERAKAIGIWTAVGALGIGLGPVLGGYLVDQFSWSAVFLIHIPIILAALAGLLIVPESSDERGLRLDIPGAILGTTGIVALVFGIIRGGEAGWTSPEVIVAFAIAIVVLSAFAFVEVRSDAPMLPLKFFRQKDFTGAVLVIGVIMFAMFVSFFFLTQYFQIVQGRSALQAGLLIVPTSVAMMISAPISGKVMSTIGPRYLVLAMSGAMLTGILLLTQIGVDSSVLSVIVPLMVFGLGAGLGMPALTDTVMAAVPEADAGVGSAVNDVSRELGGALGIAIIGSIVSIFYRSNINDAIEGTLPADVVELAREGVGVASVIARSLPEDLAVALTEASNVAFVDAMTTGFAMSAVVLLGAVVVAFTLIPRSMRESQAVLEPDDGSPSPQPVDALAR